MPVGSDEARVFGDLIKRCKADEGLPDNLHCRRDRLLRVVGQYAEAIAASEV